MNVTTPYAFSPTANSARAATLADLDNAFGFDHAWIVLDATGIQAQYGSVDTVFPFASVTKLLATWAIMRAMEAGEISLATPAGPLGATMRHLLAHASGLPFSQGAVLAAPGVRRVYSNRGIEVAGDTLEEASGRSIQEWVGEEILLPLGMNHTHMEGSPAYSGEGTASDLALFAREVLTPRLLSTQAAMATRTVQFPGLQGVLPGYGRQKNNAWGLGFEIRAEKNPHWTGSDFSPRTFGHFGQSGSFLWVDPELAKAGVFLGSEPFGEKHVKLWPALTNAMRQI